MRYNILHIVSGMALVLFGLMLENCAPHRKNVFSKLYHNTTARYNAYFIAKEHMLEVENAIEEAHERDYDRVLMIFPDIDSATIDSNSDKLEDCIKKASIAIQRHENSQWVDDSYLVIGKSWFYQGEFTNAIETLKYVYTQSEDDDTRHRALVALMRTYIHYSEHNNAIAVGDVLIKEGPGDAILHEYFLTRAYLYQLRKDYDSVLKNLLEAMELGAAKSTRAKYYFILGQLYERLGDEEQAFDYYRKSLKSNPDYELSFYAKINLAQVTDLDNKTDIKRIRKDFDKLLTDEKNREFRDRIYYEMARFELKHQNYEDAIHLLKASVRESQGNQRQKAYAYLKLAELYYDHYKNYTLAQAYYDSTVSVLPADNERYEEIRHRQEILSDFVEQINTIHDQDSLLQLAAMPKEDLEVLLAGVVDAQKKAREEQEKALKKQQRRTTLAQGPGNRSMSNPFAADQDAQAQGADWYFYNQAAISSGIAAFKSRWGNRPLEDHWRRSTKESVAQFEEVENEVANAGDTLDVEEGDLQEISTDDEVAALMATIPFAEEEQLMALQKIETAYYNLGKIYRYKLMELDNAVETFEQLLTRFPQSEYEPEVLYQLLLVFTDRDQAAADRCKAMLLDKYPETVYARLAQNPNYLRESQITGERLEKLYQIAYQYYEDGKYDQATALVGRALDQYSDNPFSDHLRLLDILITGKVEGQYQYQYALQDFIESNPESTLIDYAKTLLEKSRNFEVSQARREGARFSAYLDYPHLFVIVYQNTADLASQLPERMERFIAGHYPEGQLNVGNLVFNNDKSILLINKFENKDSAAQFLKLYQSVQPGRELLDNKMVSEFIITEDNFKLFYQTKLLDDYLSFYKEHYQ